MRGMGRKVGYTGVGVRREGFELRIGTTVKWAEAEVRTPVYEKFGK